MLTPVAYEALLAKAAEPKPVGSALDWLLAVGSTTAHIDAPKLDAAGMAQRLEALRSDWPER